MTDYNIDFKDHKVQFPNRFKQVQVSPGVVDLVPTWIENPSEVIEAGTPVNAELFEGITSQLAEKAKKSNLPLYLTDFGAKGDGVTDDSQALIDAIVESNLTGRIIKVPAGGYLISQPIDMSNLPYLPGATTDYNYRITIIGEDMDKTSFLGATGLEKMFIYNPANKSNRRSFTFENFKVRSQELFDDLTNRANLKAFELLASPKTVLRNLDFLGISECIHLQSCWLSKLENIKANRVRRGIFIDGTSPDGTNIGFADHCDLSNIVIGGWANEWCVKLLGTRATTIHHFDSEAGHTGNAIEIIGCHNVEVDTIYLENYTNKEPFKISGRSVLNSITDFSTNIKIKNAHVYNQLTTFMLFGPGVDGVTVEKSRFLFNYDAANPVTNQKGQLYQFTVGAAQGFGNLFKNIDIFENEYYHKDNTAIAFLEGFSSAFINKNVNYLNSTNIPFYAPSYKKGNRVETLRSDVNYRAIFVEESGSYGTLTGVTASTTSGSNVATFSDVTNIIPGTFLTIGTWTRVKVMSKDPITKKVVLGENAPSTQTGASVSFANPSLRYIYRALSGASAARPTNYIRGESYYDTTLGKPIWFDGTNWKDASGNNV